MSIFGIRQPFQCNFFFHFNLVLQGINDLCNLKKKIRIIQLEKVHKKNKVVMKDFCKIYKIKFNSNLSKSTFQKKLWWGDEISKKYLNGVNKNYKISLSLTDEKNYAVAFVTISI